MATDILSVVTREIMDDDRRRPQRNSIRLVREKYVDLPSQQNVDGRGILAVEFESSAGEDYRSLWGVDRHREGGWRLTSGTSSKVPRYPAAQEWSGEGSWTSGQSGLSTGVWIDRSDVHTARIVDPEGREMTDTVGAGVALFIRDGDLFDLRGSTVELIDAEGAVIVAGPWHRPRWER